MTWRPISQDTSKVLNVGLQFIKLLFSTDKYTCYLAQFCLHLEINVLKMLISNFHNAFAAYTYESIKYQNYPTVHFYHEI